MNSALVAMAVSALTVGFASAAQSPGPTAIAPMSAIALPQDRPYPGEVRLSVDATDIAQHIVRVHETVTGIGPDSILLYPQWLPGTHAPEGPIARLAGLSISANGLSVNWTRDPVDVYAFRLHPPRGVTSVDLDFQYLSPPSRDIGEPEMSHDLLILDWNNVVLYPAGYFTRRIPAQANLTLPEGWQLGSALEPDRTRGPTTTFKSVPLNTLVDSPVYAGRYSARLDLDPGGPVPVHLDLFADRAEFLAVKPEQLQAYRTLVQQAYRLFGSHHYAHYDFLYSLSDQVEQQGLEHHQSSEDGTAPDSFTEWDRNAYERDLLPHEYTHSWNGKFRRPFDLWTPNYSVPMQDSLLWVYEGQTEYWGNVLAARSGLRTHQQALDQLALVAAYAQTEPGREWRALQDTTNDEIINPRNPMPWRDWQRFENYYDEGALIWLDVDTLMRERSHEQRSLDDFARAFFGINDGSYVTVTYTFEDVVRALNAVMPYDWSTFLRRRLDSIGRQAPLDGLARAGYRLVYTDTPSDLLNGSQDENRRVNLLYSIGVQLNDKETPGSISEVLWDGPAYRAKLTVGTQILAVNGVAYSADVLRDAIRAARTGTTPIELIVKNGDRFTVAHIDYHDGLRYPHLKRDTATPDRLDEIFAPRS